MAARSGSASSARAAWASVSGAGEFGVVVEREDAAAGAQRGRPVAPAGDAPIAVELHQGGVRGARHRRGQQGQVLRPAALVGDPDMLRDARLRPGRGDRRHRILGPVERQDDDIGVVVRRGRTGGAGDMPRLRIGGQAHPGRTPSKSGAGIAR